MAKITNTGKASRGINVRGHGNAHISVTVTPGQTIDAELFDPGNRVYHGWQSSGAMDFDGSLIPPEKAGEYHVAKGDSAPFVAPLSATEIEAEIDRRVQAEKERLATSAAAKK